MEIYVFPFGVILTAGITARLEIEKYQINREKTVFRDRKLSKYNEVVPKFFHMTINDMKCVVFPRYLLASLIRDRGFKPNFVVTPDRRLHIDRVIKRRDDFELYDYQEKIAIEVCEKYLCEERQKRCMASCLVKLDTGLGKTYVMGEIIRRTQFRTVVIVTQVELAKQAAQDLKSMFSNLNISLAPDVLCDVCVLVINTALNFDKDFYKYFGLVVFDEAPDYCTDVRRSIFFHAKQHAAIGMSATPHRRDNLHVLLTDHLGPVVDQAKFDEIKNDFQIAYFKHPYKTPEQYLRPQKNETNGSMSFLLSCRDCLAYDRVRNTAIVMLSYDLYRRGRCHFVFTIIVDHALVLAEMINNYINEREKNDVAIATLAGKEPAYGLRDSMIIVATYSKGAVGISVNKATAAIWAMVPYDTRYTQVIGRITRKNAANPAADLIVREIHVIFDSAMWLRKHFDQIEERLPFGSPAGAVAVVERAKKDDDTPFDC